MESKASGCLIPSSQELVSKKHFEIEGTSYEYIVADKDEPCSYKKALMESIDSKEWILVMNDESAYMCKNHVWDLPKE